MKDTPLLFCAAMVRATLADRKTVTRRIVKPQPGPSWEDRIPCAPYHPTRIDRRTGEEFPGDEVFGFGDDVEGWVFPYGRPGDRLWGKETWQAIHVHLDPETGYGDDVSFAAKTPEHNEDDYWAVAYAADHERESREERGFPWRPSIFMPRWASRISLEILPGARAERLQLITPDDCIAEGLSTTMRGFEAECHLCDQYRTLWNVLNLAPKPINAGGQIVRYEAFPWSELDFMEQYDPKLTTRNESFMLGTWRGLPLHVYPNPYVWRIPFRRI